MSRPRSGILWLNKPHVPPILRALARGEVPLTHEGLSTLSPWRSVIYVRDLLISSGVLPPVDRFLFLFEQWLPTWLDSLDDPEHRSVLHQFATWHLLRHLRTHCGTRTDRPLSQRQRPQPTAPVRRVSPRPRCPRAWPRRLHPGRHRSLVRHCQPRRAGSCAPVLTWAIRRHLTRRLPRSTRPAVRPTR